MIKKTINLIRMISSSVELYPLFIVMICVINLLIAIVGGVVVPYLSKYILDRFAHPNEVEKLILLIIGFVALLCVYLFLDVIYTYLCTRWITSVDFELKKEYYKRLCKKSNDNVRKIPAMDFFYRMFLDGQEVSSFLKMVLIDAPCAIVSVLVIGIVMYRWSPVLFLYTFAFLVINLFNTTILKKPITGWEQQLKGENQDVAEYVLEKLKLISFGQAFLMNEWWYKKIDERFDLLKGITIKNMTYKKIINNTGAFMQQVWMIGYFLLGIFLISNRYITLGGVLAYQVFINYLLNPFTIIVSGIYTAQSTFVSFNRYCEYLNIPDVTNGSIKNGISGRNLCIKRVSYGYEGVSKILKDFSCEFKQNTISVITGINGSGKTTLLNLVAKLLTPDSGEIYIDGVKIGDIHNEYYYKIFSFVPQDIIVFKGTFIDNLCLGQKYSDERIQDIIDMCELRNTVNKMSMGLNTIIGEGKVSLSGGERQKLGIARALIRMPKVVWMDEPSSSIDVNFRKCITDIIIRYKEKENAIIIINTHDQAIINIADQVISI